MKTTLKRLDITKSFQSSQISQIGSLFILLIVFGFSTGCLPENKDNSDVSNSKSKTSTDELKPGDPGFFESDFGFPLDDQSAIQALEAQNIEKCMSNPDCSLTEIQKLADDFQFRSGKMIFRGNTFGYNPIRNIWYPNDNIQVITNAKNPEIFNTTAESEYHKYDSENKNYVKLIDGLNINLSKPLKYLFVTQGRLGMKEFESTDGPKLCDTFAAERFYLNSDLPWPKYLPPQKGEQDSYDWAPNTGFDENTNTFAGETLILCGEIQVLNRVVKLEAKNLIFYNTHIKVFSDRVAMPAGLRITTENLGYFGTNLIESNIINNVSGHKNATSPTIEIGTKGSILKINSNVPLNKTSDDHYFQILMGEHLEN